ncbi:hypothetical protein Mp_5g19510 [Marchantia polymorpha subsp. ruderalis]|uniref:MCAfunc domain-containing protein n=2 Tax=Marchantia polymorpha TaxID=3197 RepID=A0AAF6BK37_MARPO|nr:hypothetical protein MARPO_0134s0009 [Marchantia polymorpha]BBN12371.1 hypothetical protein Mp_5g19510 [Marchantia polymorpha subsp. ruderalis]|eukprot:PTQ29794.1 hypothetical protein MARPO_0134s0009 [Marchantia polymorpha]
MEWVVIGEIANVVQISASLKLIYSIVAAASNARMHKRNCRQFAQHLKLIANLLEQLKPQDVDEYPEYRDTREPLDHLERCLKRALTLVENCRDKSYLYLIAMGWHIVNQFKDYQYEIDRYLRLIPLISLVENHREKLRAIEKDRREYTMDDEEKTIYTTLLKDDRTIADSAILQRSLSRSYPGLGLERALREENEKLRLELQQMQARMELDQCDVIEHLIEITEEVSVIPTEDQPSGNDNLEHIDPNTAIVPHVSNHAHANHGHHAIHAHVNNSELPDPARTRPPHPPPHRKPPSPVVRNEVTSSQVAQLPLSDAVETRAVETSENNNGARRFDRSRLPRQWHNSLYDCWFDPFLCISTFLYPCGTFTNIAAVVTDGEISQETACHDLAFHTLYLGCCLYTCCFRRKLRKRFNIPGGTCDDMWAHILCCCCSLVQEWREIQACEEEGLNMYKQSVRAPAQQTMENYRPRPNPNNQEVYLG